MDNNIKPDYMLALKTLTDKYKEEVETEGYGSPYDPTSLCRNSILTLKSLYNVNKSKIIRYKIEELEEELYNIINERKNKGDK